MYELLFLDRRSFRDILSYVYVVHYISTFLIVCLFAFILFVFFFVYFLFLFVFVCGFFVFKFFSFSNCLT